jgi:uncharacterized protein
MKFMYMKEGGNTMLTKKLLRFKSKKNIIYPGFIDPEDDSQQVCAQKLINIYARSPGQALVDLEAKCNSLIEANDFIALGLKKLLEQRCEEHFSDITQQIEGKRWQWILAAQSIREQKLHFQEESFQEDLSQQEMLKFHEIQATVYSDLPENKIIKSFEKIETTELINRYNCALIQGLILQTKKLTLELDDSSVSIKRSLFQHLKFHRLLFTYKKHNIDKHIFYIDGPLSILDRKISYGIRLANFFPHVINLSKWKISADLKLNNSLAQLNLSEQSQLKSHYKKTQTYIPSEFKDFIARFNKKSKSWKASPCQDFFNMGGQTVCFPDIIFKLNEKKIYLELFHRWHSREFDKRYKVYKSKIQIALILGVCQSILGTKLKKQIEEDTSNSIVIFRDFPSVNLVLKTLEKELGKK